MKPSEEFLVSPIGEAVADYGESCEEASLAHDNREARLFHTEMADKHLATVERLIAEREREIRRKAIEECCAAVSQPWEDTIRSEVQP